MSRFAVRTSAAVAVAVLGGFSPSLSAQKHHLEPRIGLDFRPPKGWVELPAGGDRGATLRLFAAPRALAGKSGGPHTPVARVMFFRNGGDASQDVVDGLPRQTPFRSLADFARRGLEAAQPRQEAAKAGAFDGQRLTAELPGERLLIGQTFALDDGEGAVCFEVLADHADKLRKDIDGVFASLAPCPRAAAPSLDPPWAADAAFWRQDGATRSAARRKWAEDRVTATVAAPETGFKPLKSKYWTVLSSADASFTRKAVAAAEVARAWFAARLPELASDAPLPAVLRIFDSPDHYQAFLATRTDNRDYDAGRRELYFVKDPDSGGSGGYGMLFRAVLWHLLDDADVNILPALPRWLDNGCWEFLRSSRCDGRKIEFTPSDVERGRIDYQQRGNTMPALWHLIQESMQPSPADGADEKDWGYTPECARLMRWLWLHDGQKAFEKPTLIVDYLRGLAAALAKSGPDPTLDVATAGLGEAQRKDRNTRHYRWRDALLKDVNDTVLPLPVEKWQEVNANWLEFNKTFK